MATNFIVGRSTASAIASASRKSFFCPFEYGRTYRADQPRIVAECLELPTQVMRPDACLHAVEATRHVGEPNVGLVARQLLAQNDSAHFVEADEVERVLITDVDADCPTRFKAGGLGRVLAAPCHLCGWAGQEHGGSIPLTAD
jgi:hypothetical protein